MMELHQVDFKFRVNFEATPIGPESAVLAAHDAQALLPPVSAVASLQSAPISIAAQLMKAGCH